MKAEMESSVRSLLDNIHDILEEVHEHSDRKGFERGSEFGLEQILSLLNQKWEGEEDKKVASSIKCYTDLPLTPQQKLGVIDAILSACYNMPRVWKVNLSSQLFSCSS